MFVLSRKTGQRVVIAKETQITVVKLGRNRVKLGFTGPADVPIYREEACSRIKKTP